MPHPGGTDDADASTPLAGWRRTHVIGHLDVQPYDEVATVSAPGHLSWLARARGNTDALAYFESADGDSPEAVGLARPATPVGPTFPYGMTADASRPS
ncbi:MAG: hypothetical protein ACRD2C_19170 [Acidimicrobiales bacterium]